MAKKRSNKDSTLLYIIAILAIVIIVLIAMILTQPRVSDDLSEQGIIKIKNDVNENTNETISTAAGCWCPGAVADYWDNDCNCNVAQAINEKVSEK